MMTSRLSGWKLRVTANASPGRIFTVGARGDVKQLADEGAELFVELDHGVARLGPQLSEVARERAARPAQVGDAQLVFGYAVEHLDAGGDPAHVLEVQLARLAGHDVGAGHAVDQEDVGAVAEVVRDHLRRARGDGVGAQDRVLA